MNSEIFEPLYMTLLAHKNLEVSITHELEASFFIRDDSNKKTVSEFFGNFIFNCGIFHELLSKSDAHGYDHELNLSLVDGIIVMEGKTRLDCYFGDEEDEEAEEIGFRWTFDKKGNLLQYSIDNNAEHITITKQH